MSTWDELHTGLQNEVIEHLEDRAAWHMARSTEYMDRMQTTQQLREYWAEADDPESGWLAGGLQEAATSLQRVAARHMGLGVAHAAAAERLRAVRAAPPNESDEESD